MSGGNFSTATLAEIESCVGAAYSLHATGKLAEAEQSYRDLLVRYPAQVDTLYLLSSLLRGSDEAVALARASIAASVDQAGIGVDALALQDNLAQSLRAVGGDAAEELAALRQLCSSAPVSADLLFRRADAERRAGEVSAAAMTLKDYLLLRPEDINARCNLGALQFQSGLFSDSAASLQAVIAAAPEHPEALNNLGNAYSELGRADLALQCYRQAATVRPNFVEALLNVGGAAATLSNYDEAMAAFQHVLELVPDNVPARRGLAGVHEKVVPRWHFPMMNDVRRNQAYDAAIRRQVEQYCGEGRPPLVLDIGAGSGLLSMMAARAGAEQVHTCEMVAPVAEMAERIIARNGYASQVTMHRMKSTRLEIGKELPRRADLLITEIFDVGLLGEYALPVMAHARRELLVEGARILPSGASVMAMPIESEEVFEHFRVRNRNGCGFDLEAFNDFAKLEYEQLVLRRFRHRVLAPAQEIFDFDFRIDVPDRTRVLEFLPAADGELDAWVFWFSLRLDDQTIFATGPDQPDTCWAQAVQVLPSRAPVAGGEPIRVRATQTQTNIRFDFVK